MTVMPQQKPGRSNARPSFDPIVLGGGRVVGEQCRRCLGILRVLCEMCEPPEMVRDLKLHRRASHVPPKVSR